MFRNIINIIKREKTLSVNIVGAFLVKGASMLLALFTMPAYMRYFKNNSVLGIWFTMLSVLTWIMMFDLGVGNGLRNKLTEALAKHQKKEAKEYISSAYVIISVLSILMCVLFSVVNPLINWNAFLNVSETSISRATLSQGMSIVIYGIFIRFVLALINSVIYAIQKSAINNLLVLISNLAIFIYVSIAPNSTAENNLINMSYWQVILSNAPLLVATIILFHRSLKGLGPNPYYFKFDKAKSVLNVGLVLLWLQIVAMVVLSTHAFFITRFVGPEQVVEYNIYYKIFYTIASLMVLALTPIWSAVTKAQAERNYSWVSKLYKITLVLPLATLVLDLIATPFLQWFFDFWLKENSVTVDIWKTMVMIMFSVLFVLHYVNININNGLSLFRIQIIWMTIAALVMIPFCKIACGLTENWTGVIIACSIALLPYQIIQPITGLRYLRKLSLEITEERTS